MSEDTIVQSCERIEQTLPVGSSRLAVAVLGSDKPIITGSQPQGHQFIGQFHTGGFADYFMLQELLKLQCAICKLFETLPTSQQHRTHLVRSKQVHTEYY